MKPVLIAAIAGVAVAAPPARALGPACVSRVVRTVGRACPTRAGAASSRPRVAGNSVVGAAPISDVGGALNPVGGALSGVAGGALNGVAGGALSGVAGDAAGAVASTALAAVGAWVIGGATGLLHDTAAALGATTTPQLRTTWFSSTYWRMAAIAALLTLPFLFAAAVQALIRSDLALLARAAFGYLPLAMLAIAIVAPLTTLLLAACDELCKWISSAAADASGRFLAQAGLAAGGLTAVGGSPFLVFLIGLFTIGAAFALWIELLLREAAVYVIVLMLPLAFAALVWPARRVWAIRGVEILVALILSKFAIIAVLSLGGAAVSASAGQIGVTGIMAGSVLIMLAAFSPWVLLRMVPMAELAAGAAGSLRGELRARGSEVETAVRLAKSGDDWSTRRAAMNRDAERGMADGGARPTATATQPGGSGSGAPPAPIADAKSETPGETHGGTSGEPPRETSGETRGESSGEPRWSERPVLKLGPALSDTPVWPHEGAE